VADSKRSQLVNVGSLRLNRELVDKIDARAKTGRRSRTEQIRLMIEEWLQTMEHREATIFRLVTSLTRGRPLGELSRGEIEAAAKLLTERTLDAGDILKIIERLIADSVSGRTLPTE
jgi:Arc/MetJ-type ribon-helix-helix transcriptional regulator